MGHQQDGVLGRRHARRATPTSTCRRRIAGNTRLFVDGKQQATKAQNGDLCVFHVQPVKQWLDASGAAIASPDVPKGWKLTFEGELETVTCTWTNKDVLSCKSKVNPDAKGTFANVGTSLEVPFGGSYTITETATPGFVQDGTGKFGPLDQPRTSTRTSRARTRSMPS